MGLQSEWSIAIRADMEESTYSQIPEHLREQMVIKSIDIPEAKDLYRKDEQWKHLNRDVKKALEARSEREAQIRIKNK
jgi:hypothetical protein